jgi:polyphosphate kinase
LKKLIISPFGTRKFILQNIQSEIQTAKSGKESEIILKMNALSDKTVIQKLYQASMAGVKITLIVRGICTLRAGIAGLSENITVISIVGRFLEHARIFYFFNQGNPLYFISSSDMMPRNLDYRVEATMPITDPKLCNELHRLLYLQMKDNTKARQMLPDLNYQYRSPKNNDVKINAQEDFFSSIEKEK